MSVSIIPSFPRYRIVHTMPTALRINVQSWDLRLPTQTATSFFYWFNMPTSWSLIRWDGDPISSTDSQYCCMLLFCFTFFFLKLKSTHNTVKETYLWRVVALRRPPGRLIVGFVHQDIPLKRSQKEKNVFTHLHRGHRVTVISLNSSSSVQL